FVAERAAQIIAFVNAVLDAVIAIATGGTGGVPALIEKSLALSIPVLIGLLAAILGIGGIADKIKSIFQALSKPVQKALDWLINKIVGVVKRIWKKLGRALGKARDRVRRDDDSPAGQLARLNSALAAGVAACNRFRGRPVAGKILKPLLASIRVRYGL